MLVMFIYIKGKLGLFKKIVLFEIIEIDYIFVKFFGLSLGIGLGLES